MRRITDEQRAQFREQGYVVVPGVLTNAQLATARRTVAAMLDLDPPTDVGFHFLWPRFTGGHELLDLYREVGLGELAGKLNPS